MLKIKRLYTFMLQTFLPLLVMTFGICLFIVLMQFIWRYIDDMVGKGFDILVLAEMFFYAALSLIPTALPLSILLASLMTFGNLGERLELLAMKSAGISLIHIMRPLIIFIVFISVGAFFFQNNIMPVVNVKLYSLIYSMRQKSPELNIPEGVFSTEIKGYNVYVRDKSDKTGLLKDMMIYDYSQDFNNARVIVADSGRLKTSADKMFLVLTLYHGESFENLQNQARSARVNTAVPYRRETFSSKEVLIEFDANFTRTDESLFENQYIGKNLKDLQTSIDSMGVRLDSIKKINATNLYASSYKKSLTSSPSRTSGHPDSDVKKEPETIVSNFDSLYTVQTPQDKASLLSQAKTSIEHSKADNHFRAFTTKDESQRLRRHYTEWHIKFTIPFSCLVFFFIGAPLGAIIRKGGLGTPVVISVILFIFYYVINNIGYKMARDGVWPAWQGMWLSSAVLTSLGIFLTYKAINDSVILNADTYVNALKNLVGKRMSRNVERKEIIMFTPGYRDLVPRLEKLMEASKSYLSNNKRWTNYIVYWRKGGKDPAAEHIALEMESIVEELGNSDRNLILNKLMDYPIIGGYKQLGSHLNKKLGWAIGIFLPLGIPVYLVATYRRKLLYQDIQTVEKVSEELKHLIIDL